MFQLKPSRQLQEPARNLARNGVAIPVGNGLLKSVPIQQKTSLTVLRIPLSLEWHGWLFSVETVRMLELYQFEGSHYSEKVRLILDYKKLPYRKHEVIPGVGQLELLRISGQSQVPVLKDGDEVIPDSTAIAQYLDARYPERPIIPDDPEEKGLCLMMEAWADESIGLNARKAMIGAFNQHPNFRKAILPSATPDFLKQMLGAVPSEVLTFLGTGAGFGPDAVKAAHIILHQNLEALCLLLEDSPYLAAEEPTLADFAVAGVSMYLKFPAFNYINLPESVCGKGLPGLADNPAYRSFFDWRDRLYADYRQLKTSNNPTITPIPSQTPNSIRIE